jgi:hypothetical protein
MRTRVFAVSQRPHHLVQEEDLGEMERMNHLCCFKICGHTQLRVIVTFQSYGELFLDRHESLKNSWSSQINRVLIRFDTDTFTMFVTQPKVETFNLGIHFSLTLRMWIHKTSSVSQIWTINFPDEPLLFWLTARLTLLATGKDMKRKIKIKMKICFNHCADSVSHKPSIKMAAIATILLDLQLTLGVELFNITLNVNQPF